MNPFLTKETRLKKLRQQSEKMLEKVAQDTAGPTLDGIMILINELQDRQVELEIQNETLRKDQQHQENFNRKYFDFFDVAPLACQFLDAEGFLLEVNPTWLKTMGFAREEVIKKWFGNFMTSISADLFCEHFHLLKDAGEIHDAELEMVRKDGTRFFVSIDGRIIKNPHGTVHHAQCILRDISLHRQYEYALVESEKKFRQLFSTISDPILVFDVETKEIIDVNEASLKLYGYSKEEFLQMKQTNMTVEAELFDDSYKELLFSGLKHLPYRYHKKKNGAEFPVEISIATFDLMNRQVQCEIIRDISDRKKTEAVLMYRFAFENIISQISTRFINLSLENIDAEINQALKEVGKFVNVDRSYIFQYKSNGAIMDNTHEWCRKGIQSHINDLQDLVVNDFYMARDILKRSKVLCIRHISDLPSDAEKDREELQKEGIKSLICIPMVCGGALIGFIGFDSVRKEENWSDETIKLLTFVGEIFVSAIERKKVEEVLLESQRKYQNIIEKSEDIVWTTDLDFNTLYVSPSVEKKLGVTPEERRAQSLEEQVSPASYQTIIERFSQELEKEQDKNVDPDRIIRMELEFYHKNGSFLWLESIASGIRDENGTLIGIHGISRDITDKKLAEEKLLERENKYRQLFTTVSDAIILFNPETKGILDINDAAMAMYGYDRKDFLKLPIEIISAEPMESKKSIKETLAGKLIRIPLRYHKKKDGTIFPVEISANVLMLNNRVAISIIIRDITERKKGEEELKSREKALQDQAKRLEEVNSALNVLLQRRDEERKQLQENVLDNIKKTVFPYIEKAGKLKIGGDADTYLEIIKSNLENIASPFAKKLSSNYVGLTPKEIQIADLIRNGKSSKEISEILKVSKNAITVHRHHIRKKLNVLNKKVNLTTYLQSLGD